MSTSAIIVFRDSHESAYIRRGHDGFPEDVLPDLFDLVKSVAKWMGWSRWSGSEIGQLTAVLRQYRCFRREATALRVDVRSQR